jgi:ribonuclease HI
MWMASKQILKRSSKELQVHTTTVHDPNLPNFRQLNIIKEHSRSKEEQLVKVQSMLETNNYDYIVASDGSKLGEGSFGKCGASAVIYQKNLNSTPSILKASLGTESNNYVAELRGIEMGLQYLTELETPSKVLFLCDCVPALESSFSLPLKKEYNHFSRSNVMRATKLKEVGHHLEAAWIPGHCGFSPNEKADSIAKQAAEESLKVRYPAERKEITARLKEKTKENWQFRVDIKLQNHKVSEINNRVGKWFTPQIHGFHWLLQLASGHYPLNHHLCKFNDNISANCLCGEREDADHYLFKCECYSRYRFDLLKELNAILKTDAHSLKQFSWKQLLGQDFSMTKVVRYDVVKVVLRFVGKTRRFDSGGVV